MQQLNNVSIDSNRILENKEHNNIIFIKDTYIIH